MTPVLELVLTLSTLIAPVHRCSIEVNPFAPGPRESYFWAVFSSDLRLDTSLPSRLPRLPGHWSSADSSASHFGQVVQIGGFGGAGRSWFEGGGPLRIPRRAIVVLWDYDAGCDPTPFLGRRPWGIPGDTAYFRAVPRTRNLWVGNTPTFDVYWGGQTVYPFRATYSGRELARYMREEVPDWSDPFESPHLTAVDAFRLVSELPSPCDYVVDQRAARLRLDGAQAEWSSRIEERPVKSVFQTHVSLSGKASQYWTEECRHYR